MFQTNSPSAHLCESSRPVPLIACGELTPIGPRPTARRFRICGTFDTGFFEIDDNWAYASLTAVQMAFSVGDTINQLEINVNDIDHAPQIAMQIEKSAGADYTTTTWMQRNRQILGALRMERIVTITIISLIELVAALNILITLVIWSWRNTAISRYCCRWGPGGSRCGAFSCCKGY